MIDIGSNSAQLQVVDAFTGSPPLPSYAFKRPTLLGEEFGTDGSITDVGVRRVVNAVEAAVAKARRLEIEELYVFATSAVRDAENRDQVVDAIERRTGLRVQFLSGEDEARLTYHAAHRWYGWSAGRLLLLDIGGGSMEIVLGRDTEPELAMSLPLGAGRLTRRFLTTDPPSPGEIKDLTRYVQDSVREVADRLRWEGPHRRAIATSKTFKQLARMAGAAPQRAGPFVRRVLTVEDLERWIPRLAALPAAQRAKLRGVSASRAKQILAGALIAKITMTALGVSSVDLCPWALREGIMLRHLQCAGEAQPLPLQSVQSLPVATPPATLVTPRTPMNPLRVVP